MEKVLIGLDFGTDSVRALLVDVEGRELASLVQPYPRWGWGLYCDAVKSQFRQHPLDYLESLELAVKGVLAGIDPARVAGIGIDTTGSTPCVTDAAGTPLALLPEFAENPDAMFYLWKDHTALGEAAEINRLAKSWGGVDYTIYEGGVYSAEWFWSKFLHALRADDAVRHAAGGVIEHCDWIGAELTGAPVKRSRCAAGHKAMWHPQWGGLPSEEFLVKLDPLLAGFRDRLYTETFTADVPVGTLSPKWAAKLGLPASVVVSGGAFDCHAGAVGTNIRPGEMVKVIGTSTCDIMVAPELKHCVRGICGQVEGSVLPGLTGLEAGQSAFGDIYSWFSRFLSYGGEVSLRKLEADAAALPGNDILTIDWWNGRRTPDANQHLTGALFGLNLGSTPPMVYRALAESTAFGARRIVERFRAESVPVESIVAIGGIARKSPFVMQLCADVLNMPIRVTRSEQCCALGAAMYAAAAAGLFSSLEAAAAKMNSGFDAVYNPDADRAAVLDGKYRRYLAFSDLLEKEIMKHV